MPEGHTVHRHAKIIKERLGGDEVQVSSPQGRFAAGAGGLTGRVLAGTEAHGKHLLVRFSAHPGEPPPYLHIHLGLFGKWTFGDGEAPEPRGALRLRMQSDHGWADLRGPITCDVLDSDGRAQVVAKLGPDPLRSDADPERAWTRIHRSKVAIGLLLMQQDVLSGIGNVYRAEILFRAGVDPARAGRDVSREEWLALWEDLVPLMRAGVRSGRIITTRSEHRGRRTGPARREDAHYVYRRHGQACRVCGATIELRDAAGRKLYWCPVDQAT